MMISCEPINSMLSRFKCFTSYEPITINVFKTQCLVDLNFLPVVHHQLLDCEQSFVSDVGVSVTEKAHDNRFTVQLFENAENEMKNC
jgi:hypothetical protein